MKIVVLGAGVQGTLYGVRLARGGHDVTLVARGKRATQLRDMGAVIRNARTNRGDVMHLPLIDRIPADVIADLCFVMVRREQLDDALRDLIAARGIARFVFMVNHAHGSETIYAALGRERVVLGFPGAAGGIELGVDRYVEIPQQPTAIDAKAPDLAALVKNVGFRVDLISDMDSWLRRHAVFVTAIAGALYHVDCDARRLASDLGLVRTFILAVREGWAALDRRGVAPPARALRAIFCWVPLPFAIAYWCRLMRSTSGTLYFALHTRHAPQEMAALAADVRSLIDIEPLPHLRSLLDAIQDAADADRDRRRPSSSR